MPAEKEEILAALKALGVVRLDVAYSGGGDSGAIDVVTALLADDSEVSLRELEAQKADSDELKTLIITNKLTDGQHHGFEEVFMEYAYDLLVGLDNWCNNDGGQGEMTVYVEAFEQFEAGEIHVQHQTFYTESNHTEHMF